MDEANTNDSTFQLVIDQVEELVVTLIEEIRERPGIAAAILAGVVGAIVGTALAARGRRNPVSRHAVQRAHDVQDTAGLVQLAMGLLKNPIVRGLLFAAIQRQIRRQVTR